MTELNLPPFEISLEDRGGKAYVFDLLRRRYVRLTPEEWVRQHFVHYLINHKGYPAALITNEQALKVGVLKRRSDTVVYNRQLVPLMLLEYKAPSVVIGQKVIEQALQYNFALRVPCLVVSNGLDHFAYKLNYETLTYEVLDIIPSYEELVSMSK